MVVDPVPASFARWREVAFSSYTLLRTLEYERLCGTVLRGRTLDVGGGSQFTYLNLFKVEGVVETINISNDVRATWIADLNEPLSLAAGSFDCLISMNTLEHIREDVQLLREMTRILKPVQEAAKIPASRNTPWATTSRSTSVLTTNSSSVT